MKFIFFRPWIRKKPSIRFLNFVKTHSIFFHCFRAVKIKQKWVRTVNDHNLLCLILNGSYKEFWQILVHLDTYFDHNRLTRKNEDKLIENLWVPKKWRIWLLKWFGNNFGTLRIFYKFSKCENSWIPSFLEIRFFSILIGRWPERLFLCWARPEVAPGAKASQPISAPPSRIIVDFRNSIENKTPHQKMTHISIFCIHWGIHCIP